MSAPTYSITSITATSAKITVTNPSGYHIKIYLRRSDSSYMIRADWVGNGTSYSETVTGLESDTQYTANVGYAWTSGWDSTQVGSQTFKTKKQSSVSVSKWSWSASNGTASASETQNAYKVIQGTLSAENFSYKVWNDIVDKVALVRTAHGYTWDTASGKYFAASNCKVSAGSTLSAKIYNSVKYNIGSVSPTGVADVSTGDKVLGKYFTAITNAINTAIDDL